MQVENLIWSYSNGWLDFKSNQKTAFNESKSDLIFVFGTTTALKINLFWKELRENNPNAIIVGGSSAGNIIDTSLSDAEIVASKITFEQDTEVVLESFDIENESDSQISFELGRKIVKKFTENELNSLKPLKHIILFVGCSKINGSVLVRGINEESNDRVTVSGGIMGEESFSFGETLIVANSPARTKKIVAIALFGEKIITSSSSSAGWDDFGNERTITKSHENIVYEIDNQPALDLYKKYLQDLAKNLPSSGLRFPLNIWSDKEPPIIRSVSNINEEEKSLYFVGDVPQGYKAKLMKTNIDGLIDGAENGAKMIKSAQNRYNLDFASENSFCLVVSCIGRRLVMDQLTEEELEVLSEVLGENVNFLGFYSFGEIAPFSDSIKNCRLHNQTMTLTLFYEEN